MVNTIESVSSFSNEILLHVSSFFIIIIYFFSAFSERFVAILNIVFVMHIRKMISNTYVLFL